MTAAPTAADIVANGTGGQGGENMVSVVKKGAAERRAPAAPGSGNSNFPALTPSETPPTSVKTPATAVKPPASATAAGGAGAGAANTGGYAGGAGGGSARGWEVSSAVVRLLSPTPLAACSLVINHQPLAACSGRAGLYVCTSSRVSVYLKESSQTQLRAGTDACQSVMRFAFVIRVIGLTGVNCIALGRCHGRNQVHSYCQASGSSLQCNSTGGLLMDEKNAMGPCSTLFILALFVC